MAEILKKNSWWLVAVLAAMALVVRTAERAHFRSGIDQAGFAAPYLPVRDDKSETGYSGNQRIRSFTHDSRHWIMQTQQMVARGDLRVRSAAFDNHPEGREVHWSSGPRWWLVAWAALWSVVTDKSMAAAIEEAALFVNPLLLLTLIAVLVPLVKRWFGGFAAAVFAVAMVGVPPVHELFAYADADHHGAVAACILLTVLLLGAGRFGWAQTSAIGRDKNGHLDKAGGAAWNARHLFIASGIVGGAGLWISSATTVPVLIGIGAGVVLSSIWSRWSAKKEPGEDHPIADLWTAWGIAGALSSTGFYLVEYFPSHLGMRLEVNHPLYAIAWLGGGFLLSRITCWGRGEALIGKSRDNVLLLAAIAAVALLPLVIAASSSDTFWVSDPLLWALHGDYIAEFRGLFRYLQETELRLWLFTASPLLLVGIVSISVLLRRELGPARQAQLLVVASPAIIMSGLALLQIRWMGIACTLWIVVLAVLLQPAWLGRFAPRRRRIYGALAVVIVGLAVSPFVLRTFSHGVLALRGGSYATFNDLRAAVLRDVARWLRVRVGPEGECVVLSGPSATTTLVYCGGFKGVGTLYWENRDGLHAMVEIFSTTDEARARELIRARGITHIVVVSWDAFAAESARLAAGLSRETDVDRGTFAARLAQGRGAPFWLKPVACPLPLPDSLKSESILVYEVVPEQSRQEAALRYAQFLTDSGRVDEANKFLNAFVRRFPDDQAAWIAFAQVQLLLGKADAFAAAMEQVGKLRSQSANLAFGDAVNLAIVLSEAGDTDGAREQVRRCIASADERSLRQLPADALYYFVSLAEETGEAKGRPKIVALAKSLVPPQFFKEVAEGTVAPGTRQ